MQDRKMRNQFHFVTWIEEKKRESRAVHRCVKILMPQCIDYYVTAVVTYLIVRVLSERRLSR